jgi:integrase
MTLGPAVKEAFPDVRKRALELLSQVRLGQDPAAIKEAAKEAAERQRAESFEAIAKLYLAKQLKTARPRTHSEESRFLLVKAEKLHKRPIASIDKRDIALLLNETEAGVTKGTGAATANRLRAILSAMFTWAAREGLCDSNPVVNTNQRAEEPRHRVLIKSLPDENNPNKRIIDWSELVRVWHALPNDAFGDAVRLLVLTGARRQEIGGLRWSELNPLLTRITLPSARQKNKGGKQRQDFVIPISDPVRDILKRRPRVTGWDCVFSDSSNGLGNWGAWKKVLDVKLPGMEPWVIHDLRRTCSTGMAALGVLPYVKAAVLNHIGADESAKSGVEAVYDQYTYEPEKRVALTLWAEHVMAAVTGTSAKVVPLGKVG